MKNQGNRTGGLILIIFSLVFAAFFTTVSIILASFTPKMPGDMIPPFVFPIISAAIILPMMIGFGLRLFIKGNKSRRIMKTGRKTQCEVYNILRVKNGYQLIVSFRGDSGNEFKHAVDIGYKDAALLKPGQTIECYVDGDDCYVDIGHLVIKEESRF